MKMNRIEYFLMTFDLGRQMYLRGIVKDLQKISNFPSNKKILEIGCGNGTGTKFIKQFFQPLELIATEYDESLVKVACKINSGSNISIEQGNATALRFADDEFDAVVELSVIHHIPEWEKCLDEMYRIIKPGGMFIIKELSIETFETFFGSISRRFVDHPYDDMLRKDEFLNYLQTKGFKILDCRPHSMLGFLSDFLLVAQKDT